MTKEQFDLKYRGEKVAVHCDTEEKAKAFLKLEDSFGTVWSNGERLDETLWGSYKKETCYSLFKDGKMVIGQLDWYKSEGYTIVEFELDEPKETFKIGDVVYTKRGYKVKIVDTAWFVEFENGDGRFFKRHSDLTHKKPLKKITKEQLAEMGYEVE